MTTAEQVLKGVDEADPPIMILMVYEDMSALKWTPEDRWELVQLDIEETRH